MTYDDSNTSATITVGPDETDESTSGATGADSTGSDSTGSDTASGDSAATSSAPRQVQYDVEVIVQEQNPICWIASCAMLKGYGTKSSVGVGEFTGGFDPSNSSILNLAKNWGQCFDYMDKWGFTTYNTSDLASSGDMTGDDLLKALQSNGPLLLAHTCQGFPYGAKYGTPNLPAGAAHAVVLTGVDLEAGTAAFDNPWGDKDMSCPLPTLLGKIKADVPHGKQFASWPQH